MLCDFCEKETKDWIQIEACTPMHPTKWRKWGIVTCKNCATEMKIDITNKSGEILRLCFLKIMEVESDA